MADESLRRELGSIRAEPDEMADYRAHLADRLSARPPRVRADRGGLGWHWPTAAAALPAGIAAGALLAMFLVGPLATLRDRLPHDELGAIEAAAVAAMPARLDTARRLVADGEGTARWNALMLLTLTEPVERAARYAARGLEEDPRPAFRRRYLEYLLDQADEFRYDPARIERLLDREPDRLCQKLYRDLLHVTG